MRHSRSREQWSRHLVRLRLRLRLRLRRRRRRRLRRRLRLRLARAVEAAPPRALREKDLVEDLDRVHTAAVLLARLQHLALVPFAKDLQQLVLGDVGDLSGVWHGAGVRPMRNSCGTGMWQGEGV